MGTTEYGPMRFHAMADDPTVTVGAARRKGLNGAFETVKHVRLTSSRDLKRLIVIISTCLTPGHVETSFLSVR
jgi:hypothetical protein